MPDNVTPITPFTEAEQRAQEDLNYYEVLQKTGNGLHGFSNDVQQLEVPSKDELIQNYNNQKALGDFTNANQQANQLEQLDILDSVYFNGMDTNINVNPLLKDPSEIKRELYNQLQNKLRLQHAMQQRITPTGPG